jgi:zinc/manganese transport system permease protein
MGYFERALLAALLIGSASGLVGSLVVLRKRTFFTQALTHATFPGGVAAALLGVNVLFGAAVAAVLLVGVMTLLGRIRGQGGSVASGLVLTAGFALGALLQGLNPSLPIHVDTFLVGSILTVTTGDIALAAGVLALAVVILGLAGKEILFSTFDRAGFRAAGYREWPVELLILGLIAATVVVAAPAAAARLVVRTSTQLFVLAPVVGAVAAVGGLLLSRALEVSAGATIALTAAAIFVLASVLARRQGLRWVR